MLITQFIRVVTKEAYALSITIATTIDMAYQSYFWIEPRTLQLQLIVAMSVL